MPIQKGEILPGAGRPSGSKNKATAEIRKSFQQLVENNIDNMQKDLDKLDARDRLSMIIKIAEFILPKLQGIKMQSDDVQPLKQPTAILPDGTEIEI